ncbi:MAG: fimbria/pilus outer membrane usher protein [Geminicoccaceae bacterium]
MSDPQADAPPTIDRPVDPVPGPAPNAPQPPGAERAARSTAQTLSDLDAAIAALLNPSLDEKAWFAMQIRPASGAGLAEPATAFDGKLADTAPVGAAPAITRPSLRSPAVLGGEPTVRRRDPIDAPLLPQRAWQEWIAQVNVNSQPVSDAAIVLRAPDGGFAITLEQARAWRLRFDPQDQVSINGEPFLPLAALDGVIAQFDEQTLLLQLDVPPGLMQRAIVDPFERTLPPPETGRGATFDYDLQFSAGDDVDGRIDGLFEGSLFHPAGVLTSTMRALDMASKQADAQRLETTFARDFPDRRASLRLGDTLTPGTRLGNPVRFGGVQWASNFQTDPSFITFPRPSIGGLAEQDSLVEVFIDNSRRATSPVPSGPFEIDNIPVSSGAGEVQVRVQDLLGREQIITQSYYVSPRLLRAGLSEYAYQLGFLRESYAEKSFDYGDAMAVGSHRYGFNDNVTGEVHGEASPQQGSIGLGATAAAPGVGVVSLGLQGSVAESEGAGARASLDYEYRRAGWNVGTSFLWSTADYRQLGLADAVPPKLVSRISGGLNLGAFGRIGVFGVYADRRGGVFDQASASANYAVNLGPGTLILNALHAFEPDDEAVLTLSYSMPLGERQFVSAGGDLRVGRQVARAQFRQWRGASDLGLDYDVSAELSDNQPTARVRAEYNTRLAGLNAWARVGEDRNALRAGATGSLGLLAGKPFMTRRLGRAFGIVSLPGFADVDVYHDNQLVGRTDARGDAVVPNLRPYEINRLRFDVADLPLEATFGSSERTAVPFAGGGLALTFDVERRYLGTARLFDSLGAPLPAGLVLRAEAPTSAQATVAEGGFAFIEGDTLDALTLRARGEPSFTCTITEPLRADGITDLGEIVCLRL